ncbi:MAG TPA: DNA-3-methyladenine glycosylase I [Devosia sp.]|nr:DNA-3-methyladenine glycosylase I [Devosia sp.]
MERCAWAGADPENVRYHDEEWGRPVIDDNRLFEKMCLEGFQSGLSWLTILKKRPQFRKQFQNFDPVLVSEMGEADVERLLGDPGIVRHRGKIKSTINNAKRVLETQREFGSLAAYIWRFEPEPVATPMAGESLPAQTAASAALSKDLRKRGFSFVGPTTMYAFMQSMGLVNDHYGHCFCRGECEAERAALQRPA